MGATEEISKIPDKNGKTFGIITRPNASHGFWLCSLLPLAYMVSNYRYPYNSLTFEYKATTIIAFGLFLQSINIIFILITVEKNKFLKILSSMIAGGFTTFLFWICLRQTLICLFWGYATTLFYQYSYFNALRKCPKSFTYGEAFVVIQGFTLFILNALLQIPKYINEPPETDLLQMNAIMLEAIFCLIITVALILTVELLRHVFLFYLIMLSLVMSVCIIPVTDELPVFTLFTFITRDLKTIFIIVFYLGTVGLTIGTITWRLKKNEKASTGMRKIFHLLTVAVFLPGLLYQCTFLYIASGVALAFLIVLETFRICNIPPIGNVLNESFDLFADEKDAGSLALTPIYLLIGCSIPMWISPCPCSLLGNVDENILSMLSGVITVGIGDTAASVIGSKFGKHRFPKSQKSIEGTFAGIIAQFLIVFAIYYLGFVNFTKIKIVILVIAVISTSILEALTEQVDNLVLPLVFYILCFA